MLKSFELCLVSVWMAWLVVDSAVSNFGSIGIENAASEDIDDDVLRVLFWSDCGSFTVDVCL